LVDLATPAGRQWQETEGVVTTAVEQGVVRTPARGGLDRALLVAGAAAGPLLVVVFLVEGATRDGYHWRRHPVSDLSLGPWGWVQAATFVVAGGLFVAGAVGLWRDGDPAVRTRAGRVLLGLNGLGLVLAGVFTTDPVSGYPPGTPGVPESYSASGVLHDLASLLTFLGLPVATVLFARSFARAGQRGYARYSVTSGAATLVFFVLASAAFSQNASLVADGGLYQRIAVLAVLGWVTAVTVRQLRRVGR
jgi:hypothetical membrane protein